jgi:hypothetical protein
MRVRIPETKPNIVGVIMKMMFCSTAPVAFVSFVVEGGVLGLLRASFFHIIDIARVTAPLAMKKRFVRA